MKSNSHSVLVSEFRELRDFIPKYLELINENQTKFVVRYFLYAAKLRKEHGLRESVRILKQLYMECLNYSIRLPIDITTTPWTRRDKEGFPSRFHMIKEGLRTSQSRHILTVLRAFEIIELPPIPDLSSVIEPSSGDDFYKTFRDDYRLFLERGKFGQVIKDLFELYLNEEYEVNQIDKHYHYTIKRGVEGFTLPTAGKQSLAITEELKELLVPINESLGRDYWEGDLEANQAYYGSHDDFAKTRGLAEKHHGRITFVSASGGKTRLVAIGNYWIQDTFFGIHKILYKCLENIPTDGTFNQDSASSRVKEMTRRRKDIWSFDLTKATDRFPIQIQIDTLKSLDLCIGNYWGKTLNHLNFWYKDKVYKYQVGQPMGLYSSWAVFAITHHYLIQYCAFRSRKKFPFTKYALLGDDVAIWDRDVALRYRELILGLDIKISETKSFVPDRYRSTGSTIAEFAKRIYRDGEEITPIPPRIIYDSLKFSYELPEFVLFLGNRGILLSQLPVSRIKNVLSLNEEDTLYLCLYFAIKQQLGTQLRVNLDCCSSQVLQNIRPYRLYELRLSELANRIETVTKDIISFTETMRPALETEAGVDVEDLIINLIFSSLLVKLNDLSRKISRLIPKSVFEVLLRGDRNISKQEIDSLEFIPIVSIEDSLKPKRIEKRTRTYRSKYIAKIAEEIVNRITT